MHTHTHIQTRAFREVGLTRRSEDHSLHPSPVHITNCVSAYVSMLNSVWRKMWEEWEVWTWVWEKLPMLLSLFQICAWKHISEFLLHWLSWPTAKLEEIHNINGHCENKNTYVFSIFSCVSINTSYYWQWAGWEIKRTNFIFAAYSIYLFHVSAKDERKLG